MPCCGGCRVPHCPMGSARSLRHSCRKPPDSPRFFTCVFEASGAAFMAARTRLPLFFCLSGAAVQRRTPVPPRFWPFWYRTVRTTSACMLWGTWGAPRRVYSRTGGAPPGGSRGADSVPKDSRFPRDPSRQTRPSSRPLSSSDPSSVVPIVFPGAAFGGFDSPKYVRPATWHRGSYMW